MGRCCCCLVASVVSNSVRRCGLQPAKLLCPWDSLGKSTKVGCRALLQRIFPTQGSNPGLQHCRQSLYLSHQGSPFQLLQQSPSQDIHTGGVFYQRFKSLRPWPTSSLFSVIKGRKISLAVCLHRADLFNWCKSWRFIDLWISVQASLSFSSGEAGILHLPGWYRSFPEKPSTEGVGATEELKEDKWDVLSSCAVPLTNKAHILFPFCP